MNIQKISNFINEAVQKSVFPGCVLLCAEQDNIIIHEAYGKADIYTGRKMTIDTIFDLASLTKPLATALVTSKLIEKKQIRFSDKVKDILPEVSGMEAGQVTIDMLLRHTSGLPAYKEYYKKLSKSHAEARQEIRQLVILERLENPPGKVQVYSDLGFILLAWIIETITGKRLDRMVKNYIYGPLSIDDLFFIDLENNPFLKKAGASNFAATQNCPWRNKLLVGEVDDDNAWAVGGVEGHAGLFGDAYSVYRVCSELLKVMNHNSSLILDPATLKSFLKKKGSFDMVAGFDTPSKMNSSAGHFFSDLSIGHLGFTGTSFWIDPKVDLIVVLLTNRVHPSRSNEDIKKFRPQLHDLIRSTIA